MRTGALVFCLGAIATGYSAALPAPGAVFLFALQFALLAWLLARKACRRSSFVFIVLASAFSGICWHSFRATAILAQHLPSALEGVDMQVTGIVVNLPQRNDRAQQFQFFIEEGNAAFEKRLVLLNYYGSAEIAAAQRWQLVLRLNRPHGFANPGGMDYEAWLLQQGITAKGYVRDSTRNQLLTDSLWSVQSLRFWLRSETNRLGSELRHRPVILALALGDRSQLSTAQWDLYTRTGTNHLMVVSGLHVGFVAGLCFLALSWLWRRSERLMLTIPAQHAGAIAAIAGAAGYSLLAGFSLPTQRALVMVAVFMLGKLLAVRLPASLSLLLALTVILVINPTAAMGAGFWLSFVAVAALLLVFAGAGNAARDSLSSSLWAKWLKPQLTVSFALLVPLAVWMQQIPILSPLANTLAIPLVSIAVVPLCLLGILLLPFSEPLALLAFSAADYLIELLHWLLSWLVANLPGLDSWQIILQSRWPLVFAAPACLLLLSPLPRRYLILAVVMLLPLLFPRHIKSVQNELVVHVLDVGQGLAVVVRTGSHVLVYDSGPRFGDSFDSGSAIVVPVLRSLGIAAIDTLLISHGDNDHAGGAGGILGSIAVAQVMSSAELPDLATHITACEAGQSWQWEDAHFQILHPALPLGSSTNNNSCVLSIEFAGHRILLPGDIEAVIERRLLAQQPEALRSTLLVAAHHGSNSSSIQAFINQVSPRYVVYSAGYRNQFGHPAEKVVARFWALGSSAVQTAELGMLTFRITAEGIFQTPLSYREQRRRYWN